MGDAIGRAIEASRRVSNMILSSSAFNYQRIERKLSTIVLSLLNVGNGGYYRLDKMGAEVARLTPSNQAQLVACDDRLHGYVTLTINRDTISGILTLVDEKGGTISQKDKFIYSASACMLKKAKRSVCGCPQNEIPGVWLVIEIDREHRIPKTCFL